MTATRHASTPGKASRSERDAVLGDPMAVPPPLSRVPRTGLPPGPNGRTRATVEWVVRPTEMLERARRQYGKTFSAELFGLGTVVCVSEPEHVKQVFTGDSSVLHAGKAAMLLAPIVGFNSLLCLDGSRHLAERRLMLPPFHGRALAGYERTMREVSAAAVERWPRGQRIELQPLMAEITLEIITRTVFGIEDAARHARMQEAVRVLLDDGATMVAFQLPPLRRTIGPYRAWQRFRKMVTDLDDLIYAEIARRREAGDCDERDDMMSMLMSAEFEDGSKLSDVALRDQLVTLLAAGHETTATAMTWMFELVTREPAVQSRLVEAVDGGDAEYVDAVNQETLRLRPVIPMVARVLQAPMEIGDYRLPAGSVVAPCIYLVNRDPDTYPDPDSFRPERFVGNPPETYTWLPFGGGVRRCLGASFAQFEMRVMTEEILARVDVRPADRRAQRVGRRSITLAPSRGTRVFVNDR